jgi:hypothetical protein
MPKQTEYGLDVLLHIDVAGWLAYGCAKPGKQGFVHILHAFVHNAATRDVTARESGKPPSQIRKVR